MSVCNHHYTDRGNACVLCFKELEERIQQLTEAARTYLDAADQRWAAQTDDQLYKANTKVEEAHDALAALLKETDNG